MISRLLILLLLSTASTLPSDQNKKAKIESEKLQLASAFANEAELFEELYLSVRTLAKLADIFWEIDEAFARSLVQRAVSRIRLDADDNKQKAKALNGLAMRVVQHDAELAQEIIEIGTAFKMTPQEKANSYHQMSRSLLGTSTGEASRLAAQSIQTNFHPVVVHLLNSIRKEDAAKADELFLQTLTQLTLQPSPRMEDFLYLGNYVYSSNPPGSNLPDGVSVTVIGGVQVAFFPYERAEATLAAKAAYLQTAIELLTKLPVPSEQRAAHVAAGMQLLPRIRQFRPDAAPNIELAMRSHAQNVHPQLYDESILKNLNTPKQEISLDERSRRLDMPASDLERNLDCLVLAREAANRGQYDLMQVIAAKARDKELGQALHKISLFLSLKKKIRDGTLKFPSEIIRSIPAGIERVSALLFLAQTALSSNQIEIARETSRTALGQIEGVSDSAKPWVILSAMNAFDCEEAQRWMFPMFAALSNSSPPSSDFIISLSVSSISRSFLLIEPPTLSDGLQSVIRCDAELVATAISTIKGEDAKGEIMTTIIQSLLQKETKTDDGKTLVPAPSQPSRYKVAEKSIRRIILKKVMPLYPQSSVKNNAVGVGVAKVLIDVEGKVIQTAILQAPDKIISAEIEKAVKQWRFEVTMSDGTPVIVDSFLTFYFTIENGKGFVRDPKIFQRKE